MQVLTRISSSVLPLFLLVTVAGAAPPEVRSTLDDQRELAITIYHDDLALVRDQRQVDILAGENRLALRDVAARIHPETALLQNLDRPQGITFWEQSFDYDLLSPEKLLEKYVGCEVQVLRTNSQSGVESSESALILSANGPVLQFADRIETSAPGRIVFGELPAELRERPTLVTTFTSRKAAKERLELTYLTGGLSWRADYVAQLSAQEDRLDLFAWVTLDNQSGATYRHARLQLVAGDVNRVRSAVPMLMKSMAADQAEGMREEGLFEYHLYTLDRLTTLRDQQSKQLALIFAKGVAVSKGYELRGADYLYTGRHGELGDKLKIATWLTFANQEKNQLGRPLPQGIVRVYQQDSTGHPQFVGEDRIDPTPKDGSVRLFLGNSFNLTAERRQTDFKKVATNDQNIQSAESAFRIILRNAQEEQVMVQVIEPLPGEWEILSENLPHLRGPGQSASWAVPVPARGETILEYRVRVRY